LSAAAARGRWPAVLALVFNAFTWGVSWWPFRRLEALGLHPLWLTAAAFSVAVAALMITRPRALREVARTPALWVLVLASGTTNACFNWGVTIGDVLRVVLLFYLMPLWAVLLARPLLGERITARSGAQVALALAGALVVLWPFGDSVTAPLGLADGLALLGGFCFALNNVMLRRESHRSEGARALAMFGGGVVVGGVLAAALSLVGAVPAPPAPAAGWLLGVAALALWFLASNLALQYGAARLPAHTTAVVMLTEVAFASASAVALGAAALEPRSVVGGALIVGAALLATRRAA
jgi:drug/metabolite transporter (DMT)-like permease